MATAVAFELKADYRDSFAGGSVTLRGRGEHVDLAELLDAGNGRIETDDQRLVEALVDAEALQRVPVEATATAGPKPLDEQTVAELRATAAESGVDLGDATRKDDILAVLVAAQTESEA
jgi:hypothetical protein